MGGDGGSLNNTREEYTRLRRTLQQNRDISADEAHNRQRSSTTHCALTKVELQPPHVVGDRLGQLYNKEALLRHMILRAERVRTGQCTGDSGTDSILSHIRSVKKDTVTISLRTVDGSGLFVCPITRRTITPEGRFSFGWTCGCVAADSVPVDTGTINGTQSPCLVCGTRGERIPLGMTLERRQVVRKAIIQKREKRSKEGNHGKRKFRTTQSLPNVKEDSSPTRKMARVNEHVDRTNKSEHFSGVECQHST